MPRALADVLPTLRDPARAASIQVALLLARYGYEHAIPVLRGPPRNAPVSARWVEATSLPASPGARHQSASAEVEPSSTPSSAHNRIPNGLAVVALSDRHASLEALAAVRSKDPARSSIATPEPFVVIGPQQALTA